ncbi:MAG: hypothetical protein COV66_02240 [Nitrospinae bacterium CG11_big_fil_rev_8_21_14_0_20_45_15]|nr:MAG: hypothetical protein COV66_02240 [Nitrospinae bacterium CG11_big_fil_rev_8_21_14_0_20_45_15]
MFFQVRIKDAQGNVKKIIPSESLSKRYWDEFFNNSSEGETIKNSEKRGKKSVKKDRENIQDSMIEEDWNL